MVNAGQRSTKADVAPRVDVAMKRFGTWGRVQESGGTPDLQAAREGASGVESRRFLCR